jgi:transcription initiation factor TFIID TATA-box-binding protein
MAKIKIENVVASSSLGVELDLQSIALALEGAEYEPEQFPGLIYRLKDPKTATLLFRSGLHGGQEPRACQGRRQQGRETA